MPTLSLYDRLFGRSEEAEMARLSGALETVPRRRERLIDPRWDRKAVGNPEKGFAQHPEGVLS